MSADAGAAAVPVPVDAGTRPSSGRPELGAAGRGEGTNLTNSRVAVKGMASSCGTRCVRRSRSRARGKWGHVAYMDVRARRTSGRPGRPLDLAVLGEPVRCGLLRPCSSFTSFVFETGGDRRPGRRRSGQLTAAGPAELRAGAFSFRSESASGERSSGSKSNGRREREALDTSQ